MDFVKQIVLKVKQLVTSPRELFDATKKEEGIKEAFGYLAILTLVNVVLGTLVIYLVTGKAFPSFGLSGIVIDYIFSLLFSFVLVGLLHIWLKLFKGKGNFSQTYRLYVYANTPKLLLGWIPYFLVSIFASIYSLVLMAVASQELSGFSQKKSIIVFGLLAVVLVILTVLIGFAVASLISSMPVTP